MDFEGSRWVSTKRENSNIKSSFILHSSSFILHSSSFILHSSSFILYPSSFILHPSSFIMLLRKWKGETTKKTTLWTTSSKNTQKKHNTFWEKKFSPKANTIENQLLELKNRKIPP